MSISTLLLLAVAVVGIIFVIAWIAEVRKRGAFAWPKPVELAVGFVTDFFDTLGIGSFAPTISLFKFFKLVPDERVPGTLNAGHALPTIFEAFAFIAIINVDPLTLVSMILASVAGAWLGAGAVARLPKRYVQIGIGCALLVAAALFLTKNLNWIPGGGDALGLRGPTLAFAIFANFCLGALMTLGIGLYAPALILVSLLGMNPKTAWPIMMGSCAFLMPIASIRFIRLDAYSLQAALGLTLGGIPGVLIAAYIVKSLPITAVRWLVVIVVIYAAVAMLRSAANDRKAAATAPFSP
ncbi:MAG: sulfite exporter TauE/SafE family protein [Candidatus Eremiobacteraeota bacterium]|nr:sulfite exporter TauE/SafE family protein [Candidatus Eremiobacteraeota bacterium]